MNYKNYIELGFERTDLNDSVNFNKTGYYGFALEFKVNKHLSIFVSDDDLDSPKLYYKGDFLMEIDVFQVNKLTDFVEKKPKYSRALLDEAIKKSKLNEKPDEYCDISMRA